MNILASEDELYASKDLLDQYAKREEPAGTTDEQLWSDNEDVESNPFTKTHNTRMKIFCSHLGCSVSDPFIIARGCLQRSNP